MGLIEDEVLEVSRLCCNVILGSKLITCMSSLIRVDLYQTESRQLTACIRFPSEYPRNKLLVEFKSKTMSLTFLERFTKICDEKGAGFVGKPQVMSMLKFVDGYLRENPLCIVTQEIFGVKKLLEGTGGELKLRQKSSSVSLMARGGPYYFGAKFHVPEEYPVQRIQWEDCDCNLPQALIRFVNGQSKEIARQCVEAPLRKLKTDQEFQPKPSLERTLRFIIEALKGLPTDRCPICEELSLPSTLVEAEISDEDDRFLIRMFCGHIYHQGCLKKYMSEPPFPPGGKICPAKRKHPRSDRSAGRRPAVESNELCQQRVTHDKWGLNDVKSAEAKWAHQQARIRELEEVIDFMS
ncbi:conserved hypothetical protein [Culex quinquefasciatus]|uniref:RING-type domain-containing protein n=1 Tax=Culex quinquefasciatus TaxID=7176 RepID=B0WZU9_CULQU|nr:conserved hypothetical protein [Culex quinquefasciatus]|eukprot:XP_001862921.1 conserved hypothetical protein [Culex quinquefasciatus]